MDINTHGFEKEENEHAGVKQVYNDITPRMPQSEMVVALKKMAGDKYLFKCIYSFEWKAAEYIIELENTIKNEKEKLLNIPVRCLTTAEISRLKNLLRTLR